MIKFLKKINLNKKVRGSATVEAALIFPLIMFIMFGIIYLTIIHYQNNVMIAESIRAMNRAGAYWQYIDMDEKGKFISKNDNNKIPTPFNDTIPADGIINIEMIKNRNEYRTIIDVVADTIASLLNLEKGMKYYNTKEYVLSRLSGVKFKQYNKDKDGNRLEAEIEGDVEGGGFILFGKDLSVNIGKSYINPMQNLAKSFGITILENKKWKKNIKINSVISNQTEFIRNIDTIYNLGHDLVGFIGEKVGIY